MGREAIMDDSAGTRQIGSPRSGNATFVSAKVSELGVFELEVPGAPAESEPIWPDETPEAQ
jgi:hypothetical protein